MTEPTPINKRRRYTKADKAKAVGIAEVSSQRAAADQTGIPLSTIHVWFQSEEFARLRTEKADVVGEMFWAGVQVGVEQVIAGLKGDAKLSEKSVALGILYDKYALMTGQATNRSEHRELSDEMDDHEKDVLQGILRDAAVSE